VNARDVGHTYTQGIIINVKLNAKLDSQRRLSFKYEENSEILNIPIEPGANRIIQNFPYVSSIEISLSYARKHWTTDYRLLSTVHPSAKFFIEQYKQKFVVKLIGPTFAHFYFHNKNTRRHKGR